MRALVRMVVTPGTLNIGGGLAPAGVVSALVPVLLADCTRIGLPSSERPWVWSSGSHRARAISGLCPVSKRVFCEHLLAKAVPYPARILVSAALPASALESPRRLTGQTSVQEIDLTAAGVE